MWMVPSFSTDDSALVCTIALLHTPSELGDTPRQRQTGGSNPRPPPTEPEVKACSVKGDFGENRGISVQKVVQKVMYWELGLEKWSRTGSILMIYEN